MRFPHVLLAAIFILFATTASLETSAHPKTTTEPDGGANGETRLRGAKAPDEEERGTFADLKMWVKTSYWARFEKSDDFVKKALKLEGLSGDAMKASPKYEQYLLYLYKVQGVKMDNIVVDKVSPTIVWLNRMSSAQRENSDALTFYMRYAKRYDSKVYHNGCTAITPNTGAEMDALLRVWTKADRPSYYVLERLGIYSNLESHYSHVTHRMVTKYPTKARMVANPNYSKFVKFKRYNHQYWG